MVCQKFLLIKVTILKHQKLVRMLKMFETMVAIMLKRTIANENFLILGLKVTNL